MRTWRAAVASTILMASLVCAGPARAAGQFDPHITHALDTAIDTALRSGGIPGAIVGVWSPEGDYVRAAGVADTGNGAPMQPDLYSRIGSETKTFTVTAVLQLADQNRISLDDPIGDHLDGVPGGGAITVRQLAGMRSGLVNYTETEEFLNALRTDPRRTYTPQQLLGWAFAEPPLFAPGQGRAYSNTNTILLGLLIEKVSGQRLGDYLRDHVLNPLGLWHTSFPDGSQFPDPHAQGYTRLDDNAPRTVATDWNPSWAWSAGAMVSTLDDLRTWAPALATGALLSPDMQQQRLQFVGDDGQLGGDGYGLGIFRMAGWIGHNGSLPGYQCVAVYLPQRRMTMVVLINTDIATPAGTEPSAAVAHAVSAVVAPEAAYPLHH